jgi:LAO/AO transport system kinase
LKVDAESLYEKLLEGDRRAVARLISMVENGDVAAREVLKKLHRHSGRAHIIGLTGSPGGGKSTLACRLAQAYRAQGKTVGIICVDPTSPFTGGALLGDRVRMQDLSADPDVFIRSMGSRGALGGLSIATNDVINILDAFGKDYVIVETVGAGQVEIEVVKYAHTCVVVTMPGAGDEIQAIKAGILEIADIFVVNKADREGAMRTIADLEMMVDTKPGAEDGWRPPVVATVALEGEGIAQLTSDVAGHWEYLASSGKLTEKTVQRMTAEVLGILNWRVTEAARSAIAEGGQASGLVDRMVRRDLDPHTAAEELAGMLELD